MKVFINESFYVKLIRAMSFENFDFEMFMFTPAILQPRKKEKVNLHIPRDIENIIIDYKTQLEDQDDLIIKEALLNKTRLLHKLQEIFVIQHFRKKELGTCSILEAVRANA